MDFYTEIFINVNLNIRTPPEVIKVLSNICNKIQLTEPYTAWDSLFEDKLFYNMSCGQLTQNGRTGNYSLLGKGNLKDYKGQINAFFNWIMPYVEAPYGQFIGYKLREGDLEPTLVCNHCGRFSINLHPKDSAIYHLFNTDKIISNLVRTLSSSFFRLVILNNRLFYEIGGDRTAYIYVKEDKSLAFSYKSARVNTRYVKELEAVVEEYNKSFV